MGIVARVFRPRRDVQGTEKRRAKAARLLQKGNTQAALARALRVSRQSVSRWYSRYRHGGADRLKGAGRAGRKPRLDAGQSNRVDAELRRGARAHGFETRSWTLPRVALVVARVSGVKDHPGHVWRILRRLDWTRQRPAKRARERREEAVQQWVSKRWPVARRTLGLGGPGQPFKTRAASRSRRLTGGLGHPQAKPRY